MIRPRMFLAKAEIRLSPRPRLLPNPAPRLIYPLVSHQQSRFRQRDTRGARRSRKSCPPVQQTSRRGGL